MMLVACSHSESTARTSEPASTSTVERIDHDTGSLNPVLQVGDYRLGVVPDMFVFGPELVIYDNGVVYAELFDHVQDGEARYRRVTGQVDEDQLQWLLGQGAALPSTSPVGGPLPVDAFPLVVTVDRQTWELNELGVEPFAGFLHDVRSTVDTAATEEWIPTRWVVRPYGAEHCSAVDQPYELSAFDAPVYPHLLDQYPLGEFSC